MVDCRKVFDSGECVEIAMGKYHRDGTEKSFILLRRSKSEDLGVDSTMVHLAFERGDKYLIVSTFSSSSFAMLTRQAGVVYNQDPDKSRVLTRPMWEELGETNITPMVLTLSLHLAKKYIEKANHGEELEIIVDKNAQSILPHKIYVRVEEHDGHVAPVEVQMYRNEMVISTIHMKNAMVNGKLRPFWMSITSRGKTDEIQIYFWGVVKNNHEYFTPTGLGRGELSIPEIQSKTLCPPEICK